MSHKQQIILSLALICIGVAIYNLRLGQQIHTPAIAPQAKTQEQRQQSHSPTAPNEANSESNSGSRTSAQLITAIGEPVDWPSRTPAAHRAQAVTIHPDFLSDPSRMAKVGSKFSLILFDDATLTTEVTHSNAWANGTHVLRGKLKDDPHGYFTLSSTKGILRALIVSSKDNAVYQLRYDTARESHVLLEVDTQGSHTIGCGNEDYALNNESVEHQLATAVTPAPQAASANEIESTVVDVMAVYTPAAKTTEGGLANMELNIAQSLLIGNQVLANSDTHVQLNLVHTHEVAYNESSSAQTDLIRIKTISDGYMDEVHTLRDIHAADFVVFFIDTNSVGGLGYRPTSYERPDLAFCLVRTAQSDTTSYTTIHEISHNMGNGHSKTQTRQAYNESFHEYAAGWQWNDASSPATVGYCSVMTYENFNSSGSEEYQRVPHLSNPAIVYNGNATGHPQDGDAARVIRDGRSFYAAFRNEPLEYPYATFPHINGFELSEPIWFQSTDDDHDWTTDQTGDTPSSNTGPDEAQSGSRYAYVEASSHNNETATLEADFNLSPLEAPQIEFYYHMFDNNTNYMGTLWLEASTDDGSNWTELLKIEGNQGNQWQKAIVPLGQFTEQNIRLRFRARTGDNYRSDIAIDSIRIQETPIEDPIETFTNWLQTNYPQLSDSSPNGDPDGDGINNFLEYAFRLAPDVADPDAGPTIAYNELTQQLSFSFSFIRGRDNLRYQVYSTNNLDDWNTPGLQWDSDTALDLVPEGETQQVSIDTNDPAHFIQLRVSE